jgi:hypothetical protein
VKWRNLYIRRDRPLWLQDFEAPRISRQSVHEGGNVVTPKHRRPLPLGGWVDPGAIVRPEGLNQWKITKTAPWLEPATFRFVPQCINQLRHNTPALRVGLSCFQSFRIRRSHRFPNTAHSVKMCKRISNTVSVRVSWIYCFDCRYKTPKPLF